MGILRKPLREKDGRPAALALKYDASKDRAPRVTAKGRGRTAEEILTLARDNGIPVRQDADLLELMYPLELDMDIPAELYGVVAELLAWVYKMNQKAKTS